MAKKPTNYPIEVFWSDEDEGFIAVIPDLPGCNAWGASEAEAIEEAHDAVAAWIKAAKAAGKPILMRIPRRLHAELARNAKREGVSLNQYVLYLLAERNSRRAA